VAPKAHDAILLVCAEGHPSRIDPYSFLSAVVGSNPAARRAGIQEAITAMNRKSPATDRNVPGSVGFTSTSMLARTRVRANAPTTPITIPIALRDSPFPTIKRKIREGAAPKAMRTPISAVLWRTEVASTPYKPTPASSVAIVENTPISTSEKTVYALGL